MKKLLVVSVICLSSIYASAQEIKGLTLGMSKDDVRTLYPDIKPYTVSGAGDSFYIPAFTIAGIPAKHQQLGARVEFEDSKLVGFQFFFNSKDFDTVRDAVKEKYSGLECVNSTVTNRMGAEFVDTKCQYIALRVNRFVSDINTSLVGMVDPEFLMKKAAASKKKAVGDL